MVNMQLLMSDTNSFATLYSAEEYLFCHNEMHGVIMHQLRQASTLGTGAGAGPDLILPTVTSYSHFLLNLSSS